MRGVVLSILSKLRTELQEANLRKEEWAKLLKSHGILA